MHAEERNTVYACVQAHTPHGLPITSAGGDADFADTAHGMRNETQELQSARAGVAKLVKLIRGDKHRDAWTQRMLARAFDDDALAFEHEDFMLVGVNVFGRVSAGSDLETPHRKTWGGVLGSDQAAHAAAHGPFGVDRRGFHLFVMNDFHGNDPNKRRLSQAGPTV